MNVTVTPPEMSNLTKPTLYKTDVPYIRITGYQEGLTDGMESTHSLVTEADSAIAEPTPEVNIYINLLPYLVAFYL